MGNVISDQRRLTTPRPGLLTFRYVQLRKYWQDFEKKGLITRDIKAKLLPKLLTPSGWDCSEFLISAIQVSKGMPDFLPPFLPSPSKCKRRRKSRKI